MASHAVLPCPSPSHLQYNDPDAPVYAEANEAEAYWQQCWAAAGVYVNPAELSAKQQAAAAARAAAAAEKLEATWRAAARKVGGWLGCCCCGPAAGQAG